MSAFGPLRRYFGAEKKALEMQSGATVADLWRIVDEIWGDLLPADVWDRGERRFRKGVALFMNSVRVSDFSQRIEDDAEFYLLEFMAGG